jgi:copper chaperone CopZ
LRREVLKIPYMTCPASARTIEKIAAGVRGVAKVSARFSDGTVALEYDDRRVSSRVLRDAIIGIARSVLEEGRRISASIPIADAVSAECAGRVEDALAGLDGVIDASVDPNSGRARIVYDPRRIAFGNIRTKVRGAVSMENGV